MTLEVFGEFALLRPAWLAALPFVALAALMMRRRRAVLGTWTDVAEARMLDALTAMGWVDRDRGGARGGAALWTAALVALALAGPAVERRDAAAFRNLDGVVFVLDASPSAVEGAHWTALQLAGRFGIGALGSRPAGLVIYAGDAYVATDMTADTRQLGQTLALIDADTVPDPGSRPERGLALARRMLDEAQVIAGDVILLSDGEGLDPALFEEAGRISARNARLSVVVPDPGAEAAQTLAATGGGHVFAARDGARDLAAFLSDGGRDRLVREDWPLLYWSDRGRYLLFLALLPAFFLFRRPSR